MLTKNRYTVSINGHRISLSKPINFRDHATGLSGNQMIDCFCKLVIILIMNNQEDFFTRS